jgi:Ca2+-binding RTX toxin-like protein
MPTQSKTFREAGIQIVRDQNRWGDDDDLFQPVSLTYGYRPPEQLLPTYLDSSSDLSQRQEFTREQKAASVIALSVWSDVANITFTEAPPGSGPFPDNPNIYMMTYSDPDDGAAGFARLPNSTSGGDVWIDRAGADNLNFDPGSKTFRTLVHEIGHGLGLQHPGNYNAEPGVEIEYNKDAVYLEDTKQFSIMSYFDSNEAPGFNHGNAQAVTPLLHDIAAIQRLYGAKLTTRLGDDTYGFNSTLGATSPFSIANGTQQRVWAIWDNGGIDTLDMSGYGANQKIYLEAAGIDQQSNQVRFSSTGGLTNNMVIAPTIVIENAVGGSGNDEIFGNAADNVLNGKGGADVLSGGAGRDTYYVDSLSDVVSDSRMNNGVDSATFDTIYTSVSGYTLRGTGVETLIAIANAGNLSLDGSGFGDTLIGNEGANIFLGGAGDDTMTGGAGNDRFFVDAVGDRIYENVGGGIDTVETSLATYGLNGYANVEVENLNALNGAIELDFTGNQFNNTIVTGTRNDVLDGLAGNDSLYGLGGDDLFYGGSGADAMFGSSGNDTASYDGETVGVTVALQSWWFYSRPVSALLSYTAVSQGMFRGAAGDTLDSIENIVGTNGYEDRIVGDDSDNYIMGLGGSDMLAGGDGNDTLIGNRRVSATVDGTFNVNNPFDSIDYMEGGSGNDTYYVIGSNDKIYDRSGDGTDTVMFMGVRKLIPFTIPGYFYTLPGSEAGEIENLTFAGGIGVFVDEIIGPTTTFGYGAFYGTGNSLDNRITGANYNDSLNGVAGNDTLFGKEGEDTLHGGEGDDKLYGGVGADTLRGGNGLDLVCYDDANHGNLTINLAAPSANTGAAAGDTYDSIEGVIGGSGFDIITGNTTDNILSGNAGNDTLNGDAGNDQIYGGIGADTINGGANFDYARYNQAAGAVYVRLDTNLGYSGEATGDRLSGIEGLVGTGFGDTLVGGAGNEIIFGQAGADRLFGLSGNDTLNGETNNDQLYGGAGADVINGGFGFDYARYDFATAGVYVRLDSNLGYSGEAAGDRLSGIECLVGSGFDDTLVGAAGNEIVYGLAGNDRVWGLGGNDTLYGGLGNDRLEGGLGRDNFIFNSALNGTTNRDIIADYDLVNDRILLENTGAGLFNALAAGNLNPLAFLASAAGLATTAAQRILYNTTNGDLLYDADGTGGTLAIAFANVFGKPALNAGDFLVT